MALDRETWLENFATMNTAQECLFYEAGVISECELEFGPHSDHSDCERMLSVMAGDDFDYTTIDYPQYDPDFSFFEREGRPMFPNEY
jgi:hypothetical protein